MTVVVSSSLTIPAGADHLDGNSPIIGYQNLVTALNIAATSENVSWPASNLANPNSYLKWQSGNGSPASDEFIRVDPNTGEDLDYLAIAKHNFGSNQSVLSVEGAHAAPISPADWFELVGETLLPNNNPAIFRFAPQPLFAIRLRIQPPEATLPETSRLAVLYVGKLLLLQRRIYVGHTPMPYGIQQQFANQRSISGQFLGRILLGEKVVTSVSLKNLTPSWYRANFEPFLRVARQAPFFFNWRPGSYPFESGYAWLAGDVTPQNQSANGMMQVQMDLEGIVT